MSHRYLTIVCPECGKECQSLGYPPFCKAKRDALILYHYHIGKYKKCQYCGMVAWADYEPRKE